MPSYPFEADCWEEVRSSNIAAIGTRGDWLIVQFKKGGECYRYENFAFLYDDLLSAPSVGKMFNQEVLSETKGERLKLDEWPEGSSSRF